MKKTLLLLVAGLIFTVFCLSYFKPSQAQNKSFVKDFTRDEPTFFQKQTYNLKEVPQLVKNSKSVGAVFERRELFQTSTKSVPNDSQLREAVSDGVLVDLNKEVVQKLIKENAIYLTLPLPDGKGGTLELQLVKVDIFAPGFSVKTSKPTKERVDENLGMHYRGIVKGNENSLAAISIFKNEVMGFISTEKDGNSVIGRLGGKNMTGEHIIYSDRDLKERPKAFCNTEDSTGISFPKSILQEPEEVLARCIRIYIEANYDLFLNKGTVTNTRNYITGLFNQSATLFNNEGISVSLSEIFVWNSPSPYTGTDSSQQLNLFRTTRTSFNGDLGHLLSLQNYGGRAYLDTLCNSSFKYAFSGIEPTYFDVPNYSFAVNVFTHETGHNLGSPHTHACAWNGNNTAIDACGPTAGYPYEGTCSGASLPPLNGGTIMSYCSVTNVGINFNLGFGTQPRNLIVNRVNSASCLSNCGGGCTSSPISVGQSANGNLQNGDCQYTDGSFYDAYTFSGIAGQQIYITLNSTQFNAYLFLFQGSYPGGSALVQDNDGGGGTNARIPANSGFFTLPATGTYTILANSLSAGETGNYSLFLGTTCSYSVAQIGVGIPEVPATGGNYNYSVTTQTGCLWTSTSNASWITVTSGSSGSGSGTVSINVAPNTGPSRSGTVTIAGQTFNFFQQSGSLLCTYSVLGVSEFPASGGNGSVGVTTQNGCLWTATSNVPWITITSGSNGSGNGTVAFYVAPNTGPSRSGTVTIAGQPFTVLQNGGQPLTRKFFDFDGDGKADISVFRPSSGIWYLLNSQSGFGGIQFGAAGDRIVPADYDGDGRTDVAVFRNDTWYLQRTSLGFTNLQFGQAGDVPVPADYDGDGKTDIAVYRPSTGVWFLQRSQLGFTGVQFGINGDVAIPRDFDGDLKADLAVFRPSNGIWYIQQSTSGFRGVQFGAVGDKLVPADYDGDGKADVAVFRPSTATWFINRSQLGFTNIPFGVSTDLPVPADYDGDGKTDIAVYRNDTWFLQRSTAGFTGIQFGGTGDIPVPNAFVR